MKRKRYGEAQIVFALRQSEEGTSVLEICRKMGGYAEHVLSLEEEVYWDGRG